MKTNTGKTQQSEARGKNFKSVNQLKNTEVWQQDPEDGNLWHGQHGVIVNTAALIEREFFYNIERVPAQSYRAQAASRTAVAYA
jgi:hypothetical protein